MAHRIELPRWQCHKEVNADQIVGITDMRDTAGSGGVRLHLRGGASVTVDATWAQRHEAKVGGYYVEYEDGYASFSPRAAFESGYINIPQGQGVKP